MADDDIRVPAGWYPDPLGLPQLRWWDKHAWTEHVSDARMPMEGGADPAAAASATAGQASYAAAGTTIPTTVRTTRLSFADPFEDYEDEDYESADPAAADPAPGSSAFGEGMLSLESLEAPASDGAEDLASPAHRLAAGHVPAGAPTGQAYNLDTRFDDLLGVPAFADQEPASAASDPLPRRARREESYTVAEDANTGPGWVIALLPLLMLVAGLLFLLSGLAGQQSSTFFGLVIIVPYVLSAGLAFGDWRRLKARGFARPAHWAWSLLTAPVYLLVRARRVAIETSGRGYEPFAAWTAIALLVVVSGIIAPGLVLSLSPQSFSADAAQAVEAQASSFGVDIRVACPATPPLLPGDAFECTATLGDREVPITVSLQRALGWISWRVDDWGGMSL